MLVSFTQKKTHTGWRHTLQPCATLKMLLLSLVTFNLPLIIEAQSLKPIVTFDEVPVKKSGITWVHDNAHSSDRYLPETVGAGCAFLDYDNDGWMDIYLVNSGPSDFYTPSPALKNALYRNNHDGTFTDVTDKTGVAGGTFGMGVAAGDYDGDGWVDLYVTSYGRNILYHNNSNGTSLMSPTKQVSSHRAGRLVRSGSITTTTASWICSFPASSLTKNLSTFSAPMKL